MEQKTKFIVIGLIVFSVACLFLFVQATSQRQALIRESQDLRSENTTLLNKVNQLESDLRSNKSKIDALQGERDQLAQEFGELQKKYDTAAAARDELMSKLQKQNRFNQESPAAAPQLPDNNDAYWGSILKAKTDLEMQLANIRVDLKNLQISNESLLREKNVLEIEINGLRNEKKDLLRQLDYNQKLLDSMSQEVVREKNDKAAIQDGLKSIRSENAVLNRQLKSLTSRKMALDKKVQSLQEGKSTVEKRLNEMDIMLTDKISQIDSLKNELDAIKSGKQPQEAAAKKKRESVELPAIVVKSSSEKPQAVTAGKVLAVNADNNFVIIDMGTNNGVKVADEFGVYRQGKQIGAIVVIQVRDSISACDIKRMNTPLKINDNIK